MRVEQQEDEIRAAPVLTVLLVVIAVVVGSVAWVAIGLHGAARSRHPEGYTERNLYPPKEVNSMPMQVFRDKPGLGLQLRMKHEHAIDSYGWVNRKAGVVHIPIGKAMDLYLSRRSQQR